MGRRIEYTEPPRKPRIAKMAWDYFCRKYGTPQMLYFDDADGYWIGTYKPSEEQQEGSCCVYRIPRQNIEGIKERKLVGA